MPKQAQLIRCKAIYTIRDTIVSDLSTPPNLRALTTASGMSESKMQRLFRQIFGNSIYNYYQLLRIKEAAYLIR
ncbi:helix-turn-helix transcriptional regulator [Deminuibacter soli]|uniref:AraC family transcriptional regulator n=1 Tax=Deminuibacter soli TaxID=2291815 RepID=A0A3E1NIB1_9BACT|nr:AraC family transcriptional regulator [Deminuibacter soli]RFM27659.1 AraC family transcriptional regulator [Deminuibacter soli]